MSKPTYAGSETITAANHKATESYAAQRAMFSMFNNCVVVGRDASGWTLSCTGAVARTLAKDYAFDVTLVNDCDRYTVKRRYPFQIVD
jgi:hypothetical protein